MLLMGDSLDGIYTIRLVGDSMSGRGIDELMKQSEAELDFLSAYGGELDLETAFSNLDVSIDENLVSMKNDVALPLVESDLKVPGFIDGKLATDRCEFEVTVLELTREVKRFIDRLVEFSQRLE